MVTDEWIDIVLLNRDCPPLASRHLLPILIKLIARLNRICNSVVRHFVLYRGSVFPLLPSSCHECLHSMVFFYAEFVVRILDQTVSIGNVTYVYYVCVPLQWVPRAKQIFRAKTKNGLIFIKNVFVRIRLWKWIYAYETTMALLVHTLIRIAILEHTSAAWKIRGHQNQTMLHSRYEHSLLQHAGKENCTTHVLEFYLEDHDLSRILASRLPHWRECGLPRLAM